MFKAVQSPTVSLLEASTDHLAFSLCVPVASASRSGRISFSAVGLRSYRALGRGETYLQPDVSETVTSLLCEQVSYLSCDVPCLITVRSRDGTPLTVSCRSAAQTETSVRPDGTLAVTLLPDPGCDECAIEVKSAGRKVMLLRLGFSLTGQTADGTFALDTAEAKHLYRAITALPPAGPFRRQPTAPLSAALIAALAAGVFDTSEKAAEEKAERRFALPLLKQFSRFPDKPPLRMLKHWMSETCRRLSDLAENASAEKGKALLLSVSRTLHRRLAGRFAKVTETAPEEPFLEAVGAGPAFAEAYAAYCAFARAADGTLSVAAAETALSRAARSRFCLDLCALLPAVHPAASEILRPLLPSASGLGTDGGITRLSLASDPETPADTLDTAQNTMLLASFLRDGVLPAVTEVDRRPLGPTLEKELKTTDWSRFDMLVGSLGSPGQLSSNLRFRFYYAPLAVLPHPLPTVRYIAVYQSKRSGDAAGIRYYGEVTDCRIVPRRDIPFPVRRNNPEEPYYLFTVRRWHKLRRPIPVREEGVYAPRFTHPFLFRHALESYELFHVASERDFRLLMTLRSLSAAAHTQPKTVAASPSEIPLGGGSFLSLAGDRLTLQKDGKACVSFTLSDFERRPLYHFESLRSNLSDL